MNHSRLKNLPISLKISALALLTIMSISLFANLFIKTRALEQNTKFYQASAEQCLDSIVNDLTSGNVAGACDTMKKASERKLTSFFIIHAGGIPVCFAPLDRAESINIKYHQFNEVIHKEKDRYDFKSLKVDKFIVTAGWLNNSDANSWSFFILKLPTILFGILISVISIALIVFRETRPLKKLLLVFKRSARVADHIKKQNTSILGPAAEIQQLWSSAYESEKNLERLKSEVQFVAGDVQNVLRKELVLKNEKIPYRFFSTILRFDMNNYTKTFVEDPDATQALILRLSVEADELIHRYGGLHYGFGGDEFIVVFRDSNILDSRALAFACMRDIFLKVEEVFPLANAAQKLTLKASISHSENILFELPSGLFLRGLNLILSQRYLTTIAIKDVNKMVVNNIDLEVLMPLSEFSQAQTSTLKGLPGSFELCDQTQFRSLKKQIESLEFSKLNFFRSDMDIRRLLIYLNSNDLDFFQKMKILDHLKSFRVCRIDESIVGEYLRCFQKFDENLPENKTLLSSLLIVADNLIPKEFWNEQISEVILNAKCKVDSRCNSGMLSLLAEKAPRDKFEAYAERILADSQGPDFRSVGNYLIVKAKAGLTDELLRQCVRMLKSKNDFELATGIYATSRIIQAQKNIDPVALSQFSLVKDLILRIQGLQSHQDIMVSRRALFEMRDLAQLENS